MPPKNKKNNKKRKNLNNSIIAITGAGSGIGRALAIEAAKQGAKLALCDINEASLKETQTLCQNHLVDVIIHLVDVSQNDQITNWADAVIQHYGSVNVIINNAGVNLSVSIESMKLEDFQRIMDIDFWSVVYGTQAFLPYIKKAEWGHVINVSSLFGLVSAPNQSAYNAAKFAVRGFTESLRMELHYTDQQIGVSCVHPGGVKTNIANNGRFLEQVGLNLTEEDYKNEFNDNLAKTSAEAAANTILNAIKKNRPRVLIGHDAKALDLLQRVVPVKYQKVALAILSRYE